MLPKRQSSPQINATQPELKIVGGDLPIVSPPNLSALSKLTGFVKLARPKHWLKSSFVLAPLICYPPAWTPQHLLSLVITFACFCLWASSVYAFNDVMDRHKDARHPRKCKRPVASGLITPLQGILYSLFLAASAAAAAYYAVSPTVAFIGLLYLVNNLAYCLNLRNKVILDVMSIAAGFVLRIFGGCLAVNVVPSNWMVICGFSLALLLGFGKRRLEQFHREKAMQTEPLQTLDYRKSLNGYPVEYINILLGVSSMMCLMSYMLYTAAPETVALHGPYLIYTVPFVFYGVFRYAIRCIQGRGDGPVDILTQDKSSLINGLLWALCTGAVVMWKPIF